MGNPKVIQKNHWSRNWTHEWRVTKGERLRRHWREGCQCQTCGGDAEPTRQGERVRSRGGLPSRPSADARKTRRKRGRDEMARSRFKRLRLAAIGSRWGQESCRFNADLELHEITRFTLRETVSSKIWTLKQQIKELLSFALLWTL